MLGVDFSDCKDQACPGLAEGRIRSIRPARLFPMEKKGGLCGWRGYVQPAVRVDERILEVVAMAQSSWRWALVTKAAVLTGLVHAVPALALDEGKATESAPPPRPLSAGPITSVQGVPIPPHSCPAPEQVIQGPIVSEGQSPPHLPPGQVQRPVRN